MANMRRQILVAALVVAGTGAVFAASGGGEAPGRSDRRPGGPEGRRPGLERMREEVGLSDQQAEELRTLFSQHRKAAIRQRADLQVARVELQELIHAATLDEKAIAAKVKAVSDLQAAALRARVEGQLAVQKVLTPEQREKLKDLRPQLGEGRRPGGEGRRRGMGRGDRRGHDELGGDEER